MDSINEMKVAEARNGGLMKHLRTARNKGLTLIEAAMVLAILALVVAGIMYFYQSANTSRQTTAAMSELASMQQAVRSLYGGQADFNGLTTASIAGSKALPSRMVKGSTIRHSFNGLVEITPAVAGGGADSGFQISFDAVPQEACVKILATDLGRGVFAAGVGSANRVQGAAGTGLPFSLQDATTGCAAANNKLVWIFS